MSYPKKYLRLRPKRGVVTDVPAWTVGPEAWTQADNIVFRQGVAERADGLADVYDPPSVAPLQLLNLLVGATNYWVYIGATAAYAVTGATHTDITHAGTQQSQTDTSKLSLGLLNGVPFFNNALDEPMYWDGDVGTNFVDLPGWTASESCELMVPHRFHLFALGMSTAGGDFPNRVKWSDAAPAGTVPSSWTASASNEAGDAELSDTPGVIVSAASLRNSLIIYKDGSTHLGDYIDQPNIFGFRTLFGQAGALCRHAVADVNGQHFVVTDGDIVMHDGQSIRSIAQNRRKRFLFNQLDQDNYQNLFTLYDRAQGEVWLCFPEAGQTYASRAMIYNVAQDTWGDRELANIAHAATGIVSDTTPDETWDSDSDVWDGDATPWNVAAFSAVERALVLADFSAPDFKEVGGGAETLTSVLAKHDFDFGDPERFKYIRRAHLRVEADRSIDFSVRIGTKTAPGASVAWTAARTVNSDDPFLNVSAMGRYISVEISATTDKPFKVTGIDLDAELRGYH